MSAPYSGITWSKVTPLPLALLIFSSVLTTSTPAARRAFMSMPTSQRQGSRTFMSSLTMRWQRVQA